MTIQQNRPFARRGVTQLMYVGDDDAVESVSSSPSVAVLAIGALALFLLLRKG